MAVLMSRMLSALRVIMRWKTAGTSFRLAVRVMNSADLNCPLVMSPKAVRAVAGVRWKVAFSVMSP